jgi:hypothetical protein
MVTLGMDEAIDSEASDDQPNLVAMSGLMRTYLA